MTAWERFIKTIRGESTDFTPLAILGTARYFAYEAGVSLSDFYYDPRTMIEAEKKVMNSFPEVVFIPGCWPDYGLGFFTALGLKVEWPEGECSAVRDHRYKSFEELMEISIPDPERDGLWPWYLKTLRQFKKQNRSFPDRCHCLWSMGPGEIGGFLMGLTPLLEGMALHEDQAKQVMEKLSEIVVTWIRAQKEVLTDAEMILLTDDIAGLLSPDMYRTLLLPVHQRIRALFPEMLILFHNDTASDHLLAIFPETGFDVFQLGPTTSVARAAQQVGTRMALMGNIDPVHILQNGTVEDVISASRRCLDEVGSRARFILSPGGGMNQDIERAKIEAMLSCCRERTRR